MAGVLESPGSAFDAGSHQRHHDGIHAYRQHIRDFRIPYQQQDKAFRYHHPGKHQLFDVELRCGAFSCDACDHRYNQLVAGQQERCKWRYSVV